MTAAAENLNCVKLLSLIYSLSNDDNVFGGLLCVTTLQDKFVSCENVGDKLVCTLITFVTVPVNCRKPVMDGTACKYRENLKMSSKMRNIYWTCN